MNNVLIVDTDNENIENLISILDISNWKLSILDSGEKCVDSIKSGNCPDAIILGMQLVDMSGLDLIEKIRDDSDVPVIIFSNDKELYTLVKAFDSGADDYMVFPVNEAIFMARLKALLRRRDWNFQIGNGNDRNESNQNRVSKVLLAKSLNEVHQPQM